jgi:O-antigen/teichoic acid export membrane protein
MPAAIILQILPLYLLFNALEQPYSGHILGSNNPKFIRDKMLVMFCINIGLNILLVPKQLLGTRLLGLGGAGSAIALVISAFSGWLYCRIISHRILSGINIDRHLLLHFISAAAMALIVCYLVHMFSIVHWYSLIAVAFVYLIGYISLLIVFKEFTRRDLYLILNAVNPQKLYEYTKEEIKR